MEEASVTIAYNVVEHRIVSTQSSSPYVLICTYQLVFAARQGMRRGVATCTCVGSLSLVSSFVLGTDAYVCLQFSLDFAFAYRSFEEAYL
jgi:hypothetical protein